MKNKTKYINCQLNMLQIYIRCQQIVFLPSNNNTVIVVTSYSICAIYGLCAMKNVYYDPKSFSACSYSLLWLIVGRTKQGTLLYDIYMLYQGFKKQVLNKFHVTIYKNVIKWQIFQLFTCICTSITQIFFFLIRYECFLLMFSD